MTEYTEEDITKMTAENYFIVPRDQWTNIPIRAHIRYLRAGDGPRGERFRVGGYVKHKYGLAFTLETTPGGSKANNPRYTSFPVQLPEVETIWKKFDSGSFIELQIINNALEQKNQQIAELQRRVLALEKRT